MSKQWENLVSQSIQSTERNWRCKCKAIINIRAQLFQKNTKCHEDIFRLVIMEYKSFYNFILWQSLSEMKTKTQAPYLIKLGYCWSKNTGTWNENRWRNCNWLGMLKEKPTDFSFLNGKQDIESEWAVYELGTFICGFAFGL